MRYICVILLPLFLTSLNAQPDFRVEVEAGLEFDVTGDSFERLLALKERARRTQRVAKDLAQNWQSAQPGMLGELIPLIDGLSGVVGTNKDGIQLDTFTKTSIHFDNLILKRDTLSVSFGTYTQASIHSSINIDSLFGYKLLDMSPWDWESMLKSGVQQIGVHLPVTAEGANWGNKLMAAGYDHDLAYTIAFFAEHEGIDFNGLSGDLLYDLLVNQLNSHGASLEGGADPVKDNTSRILSRGVSWQEFGISYNVPIQPWISTSVGLRYIRGVQFSKAHRALSYSSNKAISSLTRGINNSFVMSGDTRHNVGLDLTLTFTPGYSNMMFQVRGKNINAPVLQWGKTKLRFNPQVTASFDWNIFGEEVPFVFHIESDINKTESMVLPGYHRQNFEIGGLLNPTWEHTGFSLYIGGKRNIAEPYAPWKLEAGLGIKLWNFNLEVRGNSSFETEYLKETLPRSFGFYAKAAFNLEW